MTGKRESPRPCEILHQNAISHPSREVDWDGSTLKLDYKLKDVVVDDRLYAGAVDDLLKSARFR
jgi:hypothetical protein